MRMKRIGLALAGALMVVGCSKETGPFFAPTVPLAYTRFLNALPDTMAIDWRFIDQLEYSPVAVVQSFRGFTPYQATAPGARKLRVFTNPGGNGPAIGVVATMMVDETVNLEAGKYYTLVAVGFTRAGQTPAKRLLVIEDPIPSNIATNVAFRVVHLGAGLGSVNVGVTANGTDALPTPAFSNVAYLGASAYQTRAPGTMWFRVTDGTNTEILSGNGRQAPAGAAGSAIDNLTTIGGAAQAGSAMTAFILPRSVAGSQAPSGFTTPAVVFVIDKHPR